MDAYVNIVSLRTVREYSDRPISRESLVRILQAGRAAGSSQNKQPWRFHVVTSRENRNQLAEGVYAPNNLKGCQAAIAIVMAKAGFDTGRCAQNMMLAAWADGIGSAPNGVKGADHLAGILGLDGDQSVVTIISLGYPVRPRRTSGDTDGILQRIDRKPLDELVVWVIDASQVAGADAL